MMKGPVKTTDCEQSLLWFQHIGVEATLTPDAPAISDDKNSWTYRELNEAANQLGHCLVSLGAEPERLVAIYLPRSFEFAQAFFAVGKSNAAVMPIDVATPVKRVKLMLEQAEPFLIITNREHSAFLAETKDDILVLDEAEADWKSYSRDELPVRAVEGGLAYVFFTSGSTGVPNGVELPLIKSLHYTSRGKEAMTEETILFRSNVGFTLVLRELSWTIANGGHVRIVEQGEENNPKKLIELMLVHSVRTFFFSPTFLGALLNHPDFRKCEDIEEIYTLGESLPWEVQKRIFQKCPEAVVFDFYGCTEAPALTLRKITSAQENEHRSLLGEEQSPQWIALLDETQNPVAEGEVGEIYAGGHIARRYRNNFELTAERFLKNPFSHFSGERMYKTGDLARRHADGKVEYLGRRDQQIQIRGARVELSEIRYAMRAHSAVSDAVVLPLSYHGNDLLGAFVAKKPDAALGAREFRQYLLTALPAYMVPAFLSIRDNLPLNTNNKIDFPKLIESAQAEMADESGDTLANRFERRLSKLFARVLGVKNVGRDDSFFVLGGDSLAAIELAVQIERKLRVSIEARDIYANPTVALLADAFQNGDRYRVPRRFALVVSQPGKETVPVYAINLMDRMASTAFSQYQVYHAPGIWGEKRFSFSRPIESYSQEYASEIESTCSQERLKLFGYSYGGLVAYQCAQLLSKQGRTIERLVIVEPITPSAEPRCSWNCWQAYRAGRTLPGEGGTALRAVVAATMSSLGMSVTPQFSGSAAKVYCMLAESAAELKPYEGDVDLVVGSEFTEQQLECWKAVVSNLRVHYLSKDHRQLTDEESMRKWTELIQ